MPLNQGFKEKVGDKHATVSLDLLLAEVIRRTHLNEPKKDLHNTPLY